MTLDEFIRYLNENQVFSKIGTGGNMRHYAIGFNASKWLRIFWISLMLFMIGGCLVTSVILHIISTIL